MSGQWPPFFSLPAKWFLTGATTKVCGLAPDSIFSPAPSLPLPSYSPRLHSFSLWYLVTERQEVLRGSGWLSRSVERKALLVAGRLSVYMCVYMCTYACGLCVSVVVRWQHVCALVAGRFESTLPPSFSMKLSSEHESIKTSNGTFNCACVCVHVCVWRGGSLVHILVCRPVIVGVCILRPVWICALLHVTYTCD